MKPTDFHSYGPPHEIDGIPWRFLGEAMSVNYASHHVMIKLWGTDQAKNTVFNLQMEAFKYWVRPSQRKKKYPRALVVPVATWDEHFPEEELSAEAVARFYQLKQMVRDMFGDVRWSHERNPKPVVPDNDTGPNQDE